MRVCIADSDRDALKAAETEIANVAPNDAADVLAVETDVSSVSQIELLAEKAFGRFSDIALLMNNAAAFQGGDALSDPEGWRRILDVNVWACSTVFNASVEPCSIEVSPVSLSTPAQNRALLRPPEILPTT
jgi:NAD(P)-dependent dehydrogenase (short-subunit alcohol dehydrogenase family)